MTARSANLAMSSLHSTALSLGVLISNLTLVGMFYLGIPLVRSGQIDGVTLAVLALITLASFEPVNLLPAASAKIETSLTAARRLFAVADRPQPVPEPTEPIPLEGFNELIIRNLSFTYPGSVTPALQDISFILSPGRKICLVGPSGSGKSTLLKIIQHHLPAPANTVFWNGVDTVKCSSSAVQKLQAVLAQNGYLFSASLNDNLKLASPRTDKYSATLQDVGLSDWFSTLPEGLDTWLGDNGSQLSGGERQRLTVGPYSPVWIAPLSWQMNRFPTLIWLLNVKFWIVCFIPKPNPPAFWPPIA